jgi:putative flippase GtrA
MFRFSKTDFLQNTLFQKLIKFLGVGVFATLIHVSLFWLLLEFQTFKPQGANLIAFVVAFVFSYWGQTNITFKNTPSGNNLGTFNKFVIVAIVGYLLNSFWVFSTESLLIINSKWSIVGIGLLTPIITYLGLSKWVYGK